MLSTTYQFCLIQAFHTLQCLLSIAKSGQRVRAWELKHTDHSNILKPLTTDNAATVVELRPNISTHGNNMKNVVQDNF